jgi:endonuclease YncB( thermonuclease family)
MACRSLLTLVVAIPILLPGPLRADSRETSVRNIPGPVPAHVVRVVDGDTVVVEAHPWPDQSVRVSVRLRGIDTPELRSKCPPVRAAALRAKATLAERLSPGDIVELRNISGGKYYGRVVAEMSRDDQDMADLLIDDGLAVRYDGGRRTKPACPASQGL